MSLNVRSDGADQDSPLRLDTALRALRKSWPIIVAMTLAATAVATFRTLGQKKIYAAEATVMFDPTSPRPLGRDVEVLDYGGDYWATKSTTRPSTSS